jgi:uncharacterized protein involved in type VI secretion and phage assembly
MDTGISFFAMPLAQTRHVLGIIDHQGLGKNPALEDKTYAASKGRENRRMLNKASGSESLRLGENTES